MRLKMILASGLLLTACGGDDNNSDPNPSPPSPDPVVPPAPAPVDRVAITAENMKKAFGFLDASKTVASVGKIGADVIPISPSESGQCDSHVLTPIQNFYSWADKDQDSKRSTGDTLDIEYTNCNHVLGTLNGKMAMTYGSVESTSITFDMTMTGLTITKSGSTSTLDGKVTMTIGNEETTTESVLVTKGSFTFTDSETNTKETFNDDFFLKRTVDVSSASKTFEMKGTVHSSILDGTIDFQTLQPLKQLSSNDNPYEGAVKVIGSDNSGVTLTAIDSEKVDLSQTGANYKLKGFSWVNIKRAARGLELVSP